MNKKIICFVGIGIASLSALIGVVLLFQNIEKRSGEELCRTGVLNYERGNRDEAMKCWEKAADKGDVLALQLLAEEYLFRCYKGEGVGRENVIKAQTKAAELYCKAAARRNGDGELYKNKKYELGYRYKKGLGVDKDSKEASSWFYMAADEGHLGALYEVALYYELKGDERNAIKYYRRAAEGALKRLGLSSE